MAISGYGNSSGGSRSGGGGGRDRGVDVIQPLRGADSTIISKVPGPISNVLGDDLRRRFNIVIDKLNIVSRVVQNLGFNTDDIQALGDRTIYELIPPPLPESERITPPIELECFAVHWARIYSFLGMSDESLDFDIDRLEDWTIEQWADRHKWPEQSGIEPVYLFFTGDNPIFYCTKAISHIDPETQEQIKISEEDIVWEVEGTEVARGWYLEMARLGPTIDLILGQSQVVPKSVTCRITNAAGTLTKTFKYASIDPEDTGQLDLAGVSEPDNFTSTFQGEFRPDNETRSVIFEEDPRYNDRVVYMRFKIQGIGKGRSKIRRIKGAEAKVRVDGVTYFSEKAIDLHWKRTGAGRIFKGWARVWRTIGRVVLLISMNIPGLLFGASQKLFKKMFDADGNLLPGYQDEFYDYSNFNLDQGPGENYSSGTANRDSALLHVDAESGGTKDEAIVLIPVYLRPGGFRIQVFFNFNWRRKKRRRYALDLQVPMDRWGLDIPYDKPIDMGIFEVKYRDYKRGEDGYDG